MSARAADDFEFIRKRQLEIRKEEPIDRPAPAENNPVDHYDENGMWISRGPEEGIKWGFPDIPLPVPPDSFIWIWR